MSDRHNRTKTASVGKTASAEQLNILITVFCLSLSFWWGSGW